MSKLCTKKYLASLSGGKDSVALCLWLLYESGIDKEDIHIVFADTGWEHHYTYFTVLKMAEHHPVKIVRSELGMYKFLDYFGPPDIESKKSRPCTRYLKVEPLKKYKRRLEETYGVEIIQVVGIRHEEGSSFNKRGNIPEIVCARDCDGGTFSNKIWHPIREWLLKDVWAIHKRYNFPINKLYRVGCTRVGCAPCIFSKKREIAIYHTISPEHFDHIKKVEQKHYRPFFYDKNPKTRHVSYDLDGNPYVGSEEIIKWAYSKNKISHKEKYIVNQYIKEKRRGLVERYKENDRKR